MWPVTFKPLSLGEFHHDEWCLQIVSSRKPFLKLLLLAFRNTLEFKRAEKTSNQDTKSTNFETNNQQHMISWNWSSIQQRKPSLEWRGGLNVIKKISYVYIHIVGYYLGIEKNEILRQMGGAGNNHFDWGNPNPERKTADAFFLTSTPALDF